jgi:histidinol dehydrogenase
MRILHWHTLSQDERRQALARPEQAVRAAAMASAAATIAAVRARGDQALQELTRRWDGVDVPTLSVAAEEFRAARRALSVPQVTALERAIANVQRFHAAEHLGPLCLETEPGVRCERVLRPYDAVGLYVPAGSAPLPSAVIMLALPAKLAGCARRVLCTPPGRDGSAAAAVLVAAQLCGIDTVFKVGGAQAIAALAYGTSSIARVDKIFGPGNARVTAAKQLVAQDPHGAACDLPARPSEVLVIADDSARAEFVAADLLAQAEHDVLAQALLITTSGRLAAQVSAALHAALPRLSRREILAQSLTHCRCLLVPDLECAFALANDYAPEHLLLALREPRQYLARVRHAGAVFLGEWSSEPLGDYCAGPNHVLPTYGYARNHSALSVRDFLRTMTVQEVSAQGLAALGPTAVTLAQLEGLDAHAHAVSCRLAALKPEAA